MALRSDERQGFENARPGARRKKPISDDRRPDALYAVVFEYARMHEPVGSKVIVQQHDVGILSTTTHNDMVLPEEAGLTYQPYMGIGRFPTDKDYRVFIGSLVSVKLMSGPERNVVESLLTDFYDIGEVVAKTARLLVRVTRQVAVVEYPTLVHGRLHRCGLVDLGLRLLVTVITLSGRIEERMLEPPAPLASKTVTLLREQLNALWEGRSAEGTLSRIDETLSAYPPAQRMIAETMCIAPVDLLQVTGEPRIVIAGTSNLVHGVVDL